MLTLAEAAKASRVSKSALLKAIKSGRMSAVRDDQTNNFRVDPVELFRVYPAPAQPTTNDELAEQIHDIQVKGLERRILEISADRDRLWGLLQTEQSERQRLYGLLSHFQSEAEKNSAEAKPAKMSDIKKMVLMTAFMFVTFILIAVVVFFLVRIQS